MLKTLAIFLLAVSTLSSGAVAAPDAVRAIAAPNLSVRSAKVSITGTSTVHDYSISTTTLTLSSTTTSLDAQSLLQPGALQNVELQIPVSGFTSDKDGLIKEMHKALKAEKHPVITFRLNTYAVEPSTAGGVIVKPSGTLSVAGVERPIDLVLDVRESAGGLQVRGSRDLSMKDFGIKPPTMMMGILKTHDKVTVTFDLQLSLEAQVTSNSSDKGL